MKRRRLEGHSLQEGWHTAYLHTLSLEEEEIRVMDTQYDTHCNSHYRELEYYQYPTCS